MKKTVTALAVALFALTAAPAPGAPRKKVEDLRLELSGLTDTLSAQLKLLDIYERLGKTEEAKATRAEIVRLVAKQRAVLDRMETALTGRAPSPAPAARAARAAPPVGIRVEAGKPLRAEWNFRSGAPTVAAPKTPREAIDRTLAWLARYQSENGRWDGDGFVDVHPDEPMDGKGRAFYDVGLTGLALLAFVRDGSTTKDGAYATTVSKGAMYLMSTQDPDGCFGTRTTGHFVYNHAIATLALCEALERSDGMEVFRPHLQRAVDFILKAQNPYLAWRYGVRPGDNDTSVTGWMVAALAAAKRAGLRVDDAGFSGANAWLDKVTQPESGRVGYTARGSGPARPTALVDAFPADRSESLTAAGISIRHLTGTADGRAEIVAKGVALCRRCLPAWRTDDGSIDMYYWFWGTTALAAVGGNDWKAWKGAMEVTLLGSQRRDGPFVGSWDPVGPWGPDAGRIYSTAMMALAARIVAEN